MRKPQTLRFIGKLLQKHFSPIGVDTASFQIKDYKRNYDKHAEKIGGIILNTYL